MDIAVGAYTEIVAIYGPAEAEAGETVSIRVDVKNLHTTSIFIASLARIEGIDFTPDPEYASVDPGATQSFDYSFTMPDHDVTFATWSYYWAEPDWYQDDYSYVGIALAAPPEVYAGTISRKELEYDGFRGSIPVL